MALEMEPTLSFRHCHGASSKILFFVITDTSIATKPYWLHRFGERRNFGVVIF